MSSATSTQRCSICFDENDGTDVLHLVQICSSHQETVICLNCYQQYVELLLKESYPGTCPVLRCPVCQVTTCLIQPKDLQLLPNDLLERYSSLAMSLLSFQCGSCHKRSSLFLPSSVDASVLSIQSILLNEFDSFLGDLFKYETGKISITDFYLLLISKYFQEMTTSTNNNSCWGIMKCVISLVVNPERRANLHLRYLKHHPFVSTNCCSRAQCFECRTVDTHPGKTCQQIAHSRTTSEMIKCPTCSIQIVKGDGCDSVTCVCGSKFTFTVELRKFNQSNLFEESYPHDTAYHCVFMLCGESSLASIPLAKSWYDIHQTECQRSFLQYWGQKYPFCPTQSALITVFKSSPSTEYLEKAKHMWIQFHEQEYQKMKSNQMNARLSLWESLYPSIHSKRQAARSKYFGGQQCDPMMRGGGFSKQQTDLLHSLLDQFMRSDPLTIHSLNEVSISRSSALQYLTLFGHLPIGLEETNSVEGILLNAHLATIDQPSPNDSSFLGTLLFYERGDIVSSLLARHQRSLGLILHRHEEDNSYDVHWISTNQIERIQRNYLKFKGKGKMYQPRRGGGVGSSHGSGYSNEQLQMFRHLLKYLHLLLASQGKAPPPPPPFAIAPAPAEKYSSEETKDDMSSPSPSHLPNETVEEDSITAFEKKMKLSWEQMCEQNGVPPEREVENLKQLFEIFRSGDQLQPLCHVEELLPPHYSAQSSLCWKDLYGAVLWKLHRPSVPHPHPY
jgi:hypothetical protein